MVQHNLNRKVIRQELLHLFILARRQNMKELEFKSIIKIFGYKSRKDIILTDYNSIALLIREHSGKNKSYKNIKKRK